DAVGWFFARVSGTQDNYAEDRLRQAAADQKAITLPLEHSGVLLAGLDKKPAIEQVQGRELLAFLGARTAFKTARGESRAVNPRRIYRVRRFESAKVLVRVPGPGGEAPHSATAQSKTGQLVEIRPLADPTSIAVGSDLPIRVYAGGEKRSGAMVLATNVSTGKSQKLTTDPVGAADFNVNASGLWRVEFHHAQKLEQDPDADWLIYSATLSFEV
ncbi:MAG: DUF4198 domain-containing protein, partial [bacterium]|nr:DUF4198 domain-containing protein [bacterium]